MSKSSNLSYPNLQKIVFIINNYELNLVGDVKQELHPNISSTMVGHFKSRIMIIGQGKHIQKYLSFEIRIHVFFAHLVSIPWGIEAWHKCSNNAMIVSFRFPKNRINIYDTFLYLTYTSSCPGNMQMANRSNSFDQS